MSNYEGIVENLRATIAGVEGIKVCKDYEPLTLDDRLFYFVLADFEFLDPANQSMELRWTWGGRLSVEYKSVDKAEGVITAIIPRLFAAIYTNITLGGTLGGGYAEIRGGKAAYRKSGQGATYRTVDFLITAVERFEFDYHLSPSDV